MKPARLPLVFLARCASALVFACCGASALAAEPDPPSRVARLSQADGSAVFAPAGDNEWTEIPASRPLTRGDRFWTDRGARAELQMGGSTLRLGAETLVSLRELSGQAIGVDIARGSLSLRLRNLFEGESVEIDTPNLALRITEPGQYRVDVEPVHGTTRVTVLTGGGTVYGAAGQAVTLSGGQQVAFQGKELARLASQESPPLDTFDRWAEERNRREDQSVAARYVPREVTGYQQLDPHGQWSQDPALGPIWIPQGMPADWAPYRVGRWDWIAPWGWTWIDNAPWAFATSHYGRWARVGGAWAWVPGRLAAQPVYAPALVAFVGENKSLGWFALAPGEAWQPTYAASAAHLAAVNRGTRPALPDTALAHQRSTDALSVIASGDFLRGKPAKAGWLRVAMHTVTGAQRVPAPAQPSLAAAQPAPALPVVAAKAPQLPPPARPVQVAQALPAPLPAPAPVAVGTVPAPAPAPAKVAAPMPAKPAAQPAVAAAPAKPAPKAAPAPMARSAAPQVAAKPAPPVRAQQQAQRKPLPATVRTAQAPAARPHTPRALDLRATREAQRKEAVARATAQREEEARRSAQARAQKEVLARKAADMRRAEAARREAQEKQLAAARRQAAQQQAQAQRAQQVQREAVARKEEESRRAAHAAVVEQARRSAEREAESQRAQREARLQRDDQAQREQQAQRAQAQAQAERERALRVAQEGDEAKADAWRRQQQARTERLRREQEAWDRQQQQARDRARQLPETRYLTPEWQRATPLQPQRLL